MTSTIAVIARTTTALWLREVAELFHSTRERIIVCVYVAFVLALGFGAGLAFLTSTQIVQRPPIELQTMLMRTAFGSAFLTTGIVSTILCVTIPPRTAIQSLIDLLPVRRSTARLGQSVPLLLMGFVFGTTLSATSVTVLVKTVEEPLRLVAALLLIVATVAVVEGLVVGTHELARTAIRRVFCLPYQYCVSAAAVLTIALSIWCVFADVFALTSAPAQASLRDLLLHRAAARIVEAPNELSGWVVVLVWAGFGLSVLVLGSRMPQEQGTANALTLFRGTRPRRKPLPGAIWVELLIIARAPQTVVTVIATVLGIAAAKWTSGMPMLGDIARAMALAIPVMPCALGVYAVGRTLRFRWMGSHLLSTHSWWIAPKLVAYGAASLFLGSALTSTELALSLLTWSDIPSLASRGVLALAVTLFAGALVPYSEEQPLSITAGGFVAALLYLSCTLAISLTAGAQQPVMNMGVTTAFSAVFIGMYWLASLKQRDHARPD